MISLNSIFWVRNFQEFSRNYKCKEISILLNMGKPSIVLKLAHYNIDELEQKNFSEVDAPKLLTKRSDTGLHKVLSNSPTIIVVNKT